MQNIPGGGRYRDGNGKDEVGVFTVARVRIVVDGGPLEIE